MIEKEGSKNDEVCGFFMDWRPCLPENDSLRQDFSWYLI